MAENPYDLWITLFFMFKSSIVNEDYNEALRVSEYANWCISKTSSSDISGPHQATLMGFYESIAYEKSIWPKLGKALPERQFLENIGTFRYCLNESEIELMNQGFTLSKK